ncbi:hypothetical protein QQ045_022907 [Rhodiola kirilowii]
MAEIRSKFAHKQNANLKSLRKYLFCSLNCSCVGVTRLLEAAVEVVNGDLQSAAVSYAYLLLKPNEKETDADKSTATITEAAPTSTMAKQLFYPLFLQRDNLLTVKKHLHVSTKNRMVRNSSEV